jgi:type VI secretion system secreted protein VgrG
MASFSQDDRPLQVTTELGSDTFMLLGLEGKEGVSTPFVFTLELLSQDHRVDGTQLLRSPVGITVERDGQDPVHFHGVVRRFMQLGQKEGLTGYRMEVVPWLWLLSLHRDCRIFQAKSVPDIVEEVFRDRGFSDFEFRLNGSYPEREYCVQYRESDFDFVSRLLEAEGIHYYFEHASERHLLVLSDNSRLAPACDGGETPIAADSRDRQDVVDHVEASHGVYVGEVEFRDFDFEQAPSPLSGNISGNGEEKVYDYHPGRFTTPEEGERLARITLEADEARRHIVRGSGTCRHFRSGHRFDLSGHYRSDMDTGYLLTQVTHRARGGDWRSGGETEAFDYRAEFSAIPVDIPYRPRRTTPTPHVSGSQTAVVVGKSGEEIWVDRYGRVKVKFHWDRTAEKDENSSCWIRVSHGWAGKNWGAIHLPRIGEEVIVAFLEGDPDQPIIVGRVYNADHMPPYGLPDNKTQSGVKSRSSKEGDAANFNEIRFEDLKGKEQIHIHAEKNLRVEVENHHTSKVGGHHVLWVEGARGVLVEGEESIDIETVDEDGEPGSGEVQAGDYLEVESNQVVIIGKTHAMKCEEGYEVLVVDGDHSVTVEKGDQEIVVEDGDQEIRVDKGDQDIVVDQGNQGIEVAQGNQKTQVKNGDITMKADTGKIKLEATQSIELKVGGNSIKIEQSGITVKGIKVEVEGQAQVNVKAPMAKVEGSAMVEVKGGAMAQVKGGAMLKAEGAITMIN